MGYVPRAEVAWLTHVRVLGASAVALSGSRRRCLALYLRGSTSFTPR